MLGCLRSLELQQPYCSKVPGCKTIQTTTGRMFSAKELRWYVTPSHGDWQAVYRHLSSLITCRVLKSTDGSAVALSNFEGKKPVVLFFYPKVA